MSDPIRLPHDPLSIIEARILGCLCEKQTTTPDYYPLSLNALVHACNQKSNRSPVMDLDEEAVSKGIESLRSKKLVAVVSQADSRVAKYKHTLDKVHPLPDTQQAILAELLLRGPQTPGELRSRCERMAPFATLDVMRREIRSMIETACPLVCELPRQPGKKDARFAQLLCGEIDLQVFESEVSGPVNVDVAVALSPEAEARIAWLEATVAEQVEAIAALRSELAAFRAEFE